MARARTMSRANARLFGAALVGAAVAYVERTLYYELGERRSDPVLEQKQAVDNSSPASVGAADGILAKTGIPMAGQLQKYESYVSWADYRTKCPQFVIERVTKDSLDGPANRKYSQFRADDSIPQTFRATPDDYKEMNKSPFVRVLSRGHMAPAGNNKDSQAAMDATFLLESNIVPQEMANNSGKWNQLELFARDLTKKYAEVFIQTGPLWLPAANQNGRKYVTYEVIGPGNVAVPTHLYKVVAAVSASGDTYAAAFVMPNEPIPGATPLADFLVPMATLESQAGVRVLPKLLEGRRVRDLCAAEDCRKTKRSPYETCSTFVADVAAAQTADELQWLWDEVARQGSCMNDGALKYFYDRKKQDVGEGAGG